MIRLALIAAVLTLVFSFALPSTCTAEAARPRQRRAAQKAPAAQKPVQKAVQKGKARRAARNGCGILRRRCG